MDGMNFEALIAAAIAAILLLFFGKTKEHRLVNPKVVQIDIGNRLK